MAEKRTPVLLRAGSEEKPPIISTTANTRARNGSIISNPQRQTADFPPEIQALLKKSITIGSSTDDYHKQVEYDLQSGAWQQTIDNIPNKIQEPHTTLSIPVASEQELIGYSISPGGGTATPKGSQTPLRASPDTSAFFTSSNPNSNPSSNPNSNPSSSHSSLVAPVHRNITNTSNWSNTRQLKYSRQLEMVLEGAKGCLCKLGWKCWETDSNCGGFMADLPEGKIYEHRDPIFCTENNVGQFVVCLSFFRRCVRSNIPITSDAFIRAIDLYISSGLEKHVCSVPLVCVVEDELDVAAKRFIRGLSLDPTNEEIITQRTEKIPRGIVIAAAISLNCAKLEDIIIRSGGPSVPVFVEPPKVEHATTFVSPRRASSADMMPYSPTASPPGSQIMGRESKPGASFIKRVTNILGSNNRSSSPAKQKNNTE